MSLFHDKRSRTGIPGKNRITFVIAGITLTLLIVVLAQGALTTRETHLNGKGASHTDQIIETANGSSNLSIDSSSIRQNTTGSGNDHTDMTRDTIYVIQFVLARDVIEREPVDIVESYTMTDARAWCFARIHNSNVMQDVYFYWYYEEDLYFEMSSKIGISPNWRTYSSVGLQPGTWRVRLKKADGTLMDEIRFHVSE